MFTRAALTAPDFVRVGPSRIKNAGLGVFATADIPKGTLIGEYKGVRLPPSYCETEKSRDDRYIFQVTKNGKCIFVISAANPRSRKTNFTRFINSIKPGQEHKQNCEFFQAYRRIFLRACGDIKASQELLCDYGDSYPL